MWRPSLDYRFLGFIPLGVALVLMSRTVAAGDLLEFSGKPAFTLHYNDMDVPVFSETAVPSAVASEFAAPKTLHLTGAGLRQKRVLFLNFNAYVAASYWDAEALLDETDPMMSFSKSKARALQLTFVREVGADDIRNAFRETLEANAVDTETPLMKELFTKLTFDMHRGGVMQLLAFRGAGKADRLFFSTPAKSLSQEGKDLSDLFWKCWFGIPSDRGMAALKANLLRVSAVKK